MKPYTEIKNLLKQEFLKRNWNHSLYIDVYTMVDKFIYDKFYTYSERIKKESKHVKNKKCK